MTFARLLAVARPHRARLALVAGLMLAESAVLLAVPALAARLVAGLLARLDGSLAPLAGLLVAALLGLALLRAAVALVSETAAHRLLGDLRRMLHDHLLALPLAFHQAGRRGDLLALGSIELAALSRYLAGTLAGLLPAALTAAGALVLMARLDPGLALLAPLLLPPVILAHKLLGRRLRALSRAHQAAHADLMAAAAEDLDAISALKGFAREDAAAARFAAREARLTATALAEMRLYAPIGPATGFVAGSAAVVLLVLAGDRLGAAGGATPAETLAFLFYAALLTRPVAALADVYGATQRARGALARLGEVLDTPPEPGLAAPVRLTARARGAIAFEGVAFAYPGRPPAIDGLDLAIAAGERLALTGDNGAGKSTLVALLLRFHDPLRGVVRLDGEDIRRIQVQDLRRQVGLVPQAPVLLAGTIRDNIAFGDPAAPQARIEAAARLAQAHAFVESLPRGYDTEIGERGLRLSGGQAQRVALARALLPDPPILVLDEATSMVDLDGEGAFVAAAGVALGERTVILITHRPATLALATRVVTLRAGRLVADRRAA